MSTLFGYLAGALMLMLCLFFGYWGFRNAFRFKAFCVKVAIAERKVVELNSTSNLDGGFFNDFEREQYRNINRGSFNSYSDPEIAFEAKSLGKVCTKHAQLCRPWPEAES
jgi:hypothetical protein